MTDVAFKDKVQYVLAKANFETKLSENKITASLAEISTLIASVVEDARSQGRAFRPNDFFTDIRQAYTNKYGANTTLVVWTQACRILRNDAQVASYADLMTMIEKNYAKGAVNTMQFDKRKDDDISDLLPKSFGTPVTVNTNPYIPAIDQGFTEWGEYELLADIIASKQFFPIMFAGLSGNGKSIMVEQACARKNREYIRLQITPETDETDMIGGFRIKDGDTVFEKGPVITAMERGMVLLIDEIDRGSNRLMALQGVMEGKPVLIKKTGEIVHPAPGFNVIATANTKGQGDETGKFAAATILDEAFLERFVMVIDQEFAPAEVEYSILAAHMIKFGAPVSRRVIRRLVEWAQKIRENHKKGADDDYISTRRLCHIMQIFSVTQDIEKAVAHGVARYDESTRTSFIEAFRLM